MWLRDMRAALPTSELLVCFPFAGGSSSAFARFAATLTNETSCFAVQYPGRLDRLDDPHVWSVGELARHVSGELGPLCHERRVWLLGYSFGALVAFETARRLESSGYPVSGLVVCAHVPPHMVTDSSRSRLSDADLVNAISESGRFDRRIRDSPAMLELVLPAIRADIWARDTYQYDGGRVNCDVHTICGSRDDSVVASAREWARVTSGGFEDVVFDAGHFVLDDRLEDVLVYVERRMSIGR